MFRVQLWKERPNILCRAGPAISVGPAGVGNSRVARMIRLDDRGRQVTQRARVSEAAATSGNAAMSLDFARLPVSSERGRLSD